MYTTIVDNSTVSSVQRALGKAKTRDPALLDVEHAALDRFVQSLLFSERVVVPDNYKEEFTPARRKLLSQFDVELVEVAEPVDADLSEVANGLLGPWLEAFVEGSDRALFSEYFDQVNAFSKFIWEHSSSAFFLVFRAHGVGKDSPLIEALLASPKSDELGQQLKVIAKDGLEVSWDRMSRHVQRMLGVMGWLGHQFIWNQAFAARHDFIYSPHPLREFFANDFMVRVQAGAIRASDFDDAFSVGVKRFKAKLQDNLRNIGAHENSIKFDMPNFLPGIVKMASGSDDFISITKQLRNDRHVVELRAVLSEILKESEQGIYRKRAQLLSDFDNVGGALIRELGVEPRFLRIKPPTTITGIAVEGDDAGIKLPLSSRLYKQYFLHRRYRTFLRDVMADIAAPAQYGIHKTKLNGWAWIDNDASSSGNRFWQKEYRFPSKFHKPLDYSSE